jgi:penicillin-binding protein 1A
VIPLEEIPEHVTNAFVARRDANFWTHPGVDAGGIVRAILRNAAQGKKAQGASTITQQVARNFLLTNEKKWSRKIKEMILATRMEEAVRQEAHPLPLHEPDLPGLRRLRQSRPPRARTSTSRRRI